jgi:hypothetical protein
MSETTRDLRKASKAQERLAAVQSAALVGKSLLGTLRLETGSYELLSATVTLTSRGTEFEGKRSHLAQSAGSLQRCVYALPCICELHGSAWLRMKGVRKQGWALCLTVQAWHPRHTSAPYPPPAAPQCLSNTVGQEDLRKCRRWWHVGLPSWTRLGACSRNGPSENTSWQMNNGVLAADLLASWQDCRSSARHALAFALRNDCLAWTGRLPARQSHRQVASEC